MGAGAQLVKLRKERNLSQRQLSTYTGLSNATISRIEKGEVVPDFITLQKLSDFFNTSVDYIMGIETDHEKDMPAEMVILNKAVTKMTEAQRKKLLDMAMVMFEDAFK